MRVSVCPPFVWAVTVAKGRPVPLAAAVVSASVVVRFGLARPGTSLVRQAYMHAHVGVHMMRTRATCSCDGRGVGGGTTETCTIWNHAFAYTRMCTRVYVHTTQARVNMRAHTCVSMHTCSCDGCNVVGCSVGGGMMWTRIFCAEQHPTRLMMNKKLICKTRSQRLVVSRWQSS